MWIVWLEKKILKTIGVLLGIIIILVTALHIYVVNNAERLIEDLVKTESKNKLRLKVKNIKFNYFTRKVELQQVVFYSNDSLDINTSYKFSVNNIRLQVKALLPIFTKKELLVDSIFLSSPGIVVTRVKPFDISGKKDISIPEEMGRIYNSIIDALKKFQVTRFELNEGSFTLINKIKPEQVPLTITNLHVHINNFNIDSIPHDDNLFLSDQMVFRTRNQDILFPDGNHRLAFSRFRINIRKKIIEIDSCTMSGKKSEKNKTGFTIFLDTLKLVNVDFKSLYERELIKADSVFCKNPSIKLQFALREKKVIKNKLPNMDTIIQQLTGDLLLKYIGVTNAAIDITTYLGDNPSSFSSDKNNFEMSGLSIDQKAARPVSLESFDMAIRNYENYLKDSSYVLRFDSIRLRENRILLSNFSVNTEAHKDNRNIKVQQFALSGISWIDLLFNRRINARQATLYNPVIDYVQPASSATKKKRGLTASLDALDNFMNLEKIQVVKGDIKIKTLNNTELLLQNANLLMNTRDVSTSQNITSIERSVEDLNFNNGILKIKDLTINMGNAAYNGENNVLNLEKLNIYNQQQTFNISARNTVFENIGYNDTLNTIQAGSIKWAQANFEINKLAGEKKEVSLPVSVFLNNVAGSNTTVGINSEKGAVNVFLSNFSAGKINKQERIETKDVKATGKNFLYFTPSTEISAGSFSLDDFDASQITSFYFKQTQSSNKKEIAIPEITFIPDINSFISNKAVIKNAVLYRPDFNFRINEKTDEKKDNIFPDFSIDQLLIKSPVFRMENSVSKGIRMINWKGSDNQLLAKNIQSLKSENQISIASLDGDFADFSFINAPGKNISSKEVSLKARFENIALHQAEKLSWVASLKELTARNFTADSLGKKPARIKVDGGKIENLTLGSGYISSLPVFIKKNPSFSISNISGSIISSKNNLKWENLSFNKSVQTISLDTFSYHPVLSQDAFIAASPFQTDYMTLSTGKLKITKFDIDQYLKDSLFRAGDLIISNPLFTSFRDKRPPFNAGIIKPLPTKLIQRIPFKISLDTVKIQNGKTVYAELNEKTKETGIVPVTRISGDIFPIKNFNIRDNDSLRIRLNGYLMDSAWLRLRTRESYIDSLSGFIITLRMKPGSMLFLNPVLEPLASVKILSGYLDTLLMRAVGKDNLSLGEMRMFYHDLKVQFLRNDSEDKKRFLKGLLTFIANSFVIKNENHKRTGVVYFPRLRDRSFINYYIKIAMSGVASGIGAKKNKKLLRRYQKQIKQRQLPPVDFD